MLGPRREGTKMVKYFSDTNHLDYSWSQVAIAFWRKYPNPHR